MQHLLHVSGWRIKWGTANRRLFSSTLQQSGNISVCANSVKKRRASTGRWVTGPAVTVQVGVKSVFTPPSPRGLPAALISRSPGPDPASTTLWFARDSCPREPYLPPLCWSVVTQLTGPPIQRGSWFLWFTLRRISFNSLLILYVYDIKRRRYFVANDKWKIWYILVPVLKFTIRCKHSHLFPSTGLERLIRTRLIRSST